MIKKMERDLLLAIAEEIILQLRAGIEAQRDLPDSRYGVAGLQERLLCIEDLVNRIQLEMRCGINDNS